MTTLLLCALLACVLTGAFDFLIIALYPERRNRVWVFFSGVMSLLAILIAITLIFRGV